MFRDAGSIPAASNSPNGEIEQVNRRAVEQVKEALAGAAPLFSEVTSPAVTCSTVHLFNSPRGMFSAERPSLRSPVLPFTCSYFLSWYTLCPRGMLLV